MRSAAIGAVIHLPLRPLLRGLSLFALIALPLVLGACRRKAPAIDLEAYPAQLGEAREALRSGAAAEGEALYRSWLAEHPSDIEALRGIQDALSKQRRNDQLMEEAAARVARAPDSAPAHYLLARAKITTGKPARSELDRSLALDPSFTWAWAARCYLPLKRDLAEGIGADVGGAVSCLKQCMESPAAGLPCASRLGQLLYESGLAIEARRVVLDARKRWPRDPGLVALLGMIDVDMGRYSEGALYLEAALAAHPAEPEWCFFAAGALFRDREPAERWRPYFDCAQRFGYPITDEDRVFFGIIDGPAL